jgi:xylulokinase
MKATIGIDVGTSAVKVVAVGLDGSLLAEASRSYPTHTPRPGWVEQSPEDWWAATCQALREVRTAIAEADIVGVGLSGQLNGVVLLDDAGQPLGNAIIWLDTRATAEAEKLVNGFGDLMRKRAATELSAITVLAKLAWLAGNDAERLGRARSALLVKDYILWRLTDVRQTDPSDASSTGMMDIHTLDWIDELCAAAGFDSKLLPPIGRSTVVAGRVTSRAAAMTGLPSGVPVVPGGGDVAALAVGCGVAEAGVLGVTLGTAGHVVLARDAEEAFQIRPGMWRVTHADPGQALWLGLVMSGGLSLSWLHRLVRSAGSPLSFDAMVASANQVPPGANGVSFVPFLEGAATPYAMPTARGAVNGLSSSTSIGDMTQAVMEGVAFNVRQCVELFTEHGGSIREVRIAEGGARVDRWCQILADVLQRPVVRLEHLDTSSLGAALMAQTAVTGVNLHSLTADLAKGGRRFDPDALDLDAYERAYRRYLAAAEGEIARARDPRNH